MPAGRALLLVLAFCGTAAAQEAPWEARQAELGLRYWLSSGEARNSHSAQGAFPTLGNPTSVLTYESLEANTFEIYGRVSVDRRWLVKGFVGGGGVNAGSLRDEDFFAGQVRFSDSTSAVTHGTVEYGALDFGRRWAPGERVSLGLFAGYAHWIEKLDAYGAVYSVDLIGGGAPIGGDVKVISNKLTWRALRIGAAAELAFGERWRLGLEVAALPYAEARNEDSHHLRTDPADLGPAPNIIIEARNGRGVQAEAELRYAVSRDAELGVGARYWRLKSTDGDRSVAGLAGLPLVELYSTRAGLTVSLRQTW